MPFSLLSNADCAELKAAWQQRSAAVFEKAVVDRFVSDLVDLCIERDIKSQLLGAIKYAKSPQDIWVSAGRCYEADYRFYIDGRWMSIKQLIYRTDALTRLAEALGPGIKIRPLYDHNLIFLKIEFWPSI
jgi:hypothetical protein